MQLNDLLADTRGTRYLTSYQWSKGRVGYARGGDYWNKEGQDQKIFSKTSQFVSYKNIFRLGYKPILFV